MSNLLRIITAGTSSTKDLLTSFFISVVYSHDGFLIDLYICMKTITY